MYAARMHWIIAVPSILLVWLGRALWKAHVSRRLERDPDYIYDLTGRPRPQR